MFRRFIRFCVVTTALLLVIGVCGVIGGGLYYYQRLTRDLPQITQISDYRPKAVTSIYAADGTLVGEIYDNRRYPVSFDEIPQNVKNAFLAAEDANFYTHPGIDFVSILRALWRNIEAGETVQGASTITQQVVKSLVLTRERTYERKAKEAILAYRLEQALSKDEILSIYLNEIFLGAGAYGVKAAAKVHFQKELRELSLAEAAFLASLPKSPSSLIKPSNRTKVLARQHYVLDQMVENNLVSVEQASAAKQQELAVLPANHSKILRAPYFVSHVWKELETQYGRQIVSPGGLEVYTTLDLEAYDMAERAVQRGLKEVDKRRGWRGRLAHISEGEISDLQDSGVFQGEVGPEVGEIYRAEVVKVDSKRQAAVVQLGEMAGMVDLKQASWARRLIDEDGRARTVNLASYMKSGDVIEVSLEEDAERTPDALEPHRFVLDQTPEVEGALVLSNALTGEVLVIIGGYDFKRSEFNRATQGLRQPGSAFKPFIYTAAIDYLDFTPSTIVPDSPISMIDGTGEVWSPSNYDHKFLGPITLRTALQRSRNVVSVYLLQQLGVERGIETARRFGISTRLDPNMSLSLGTAEVKLLELVRAYGAFAAGGWLADSLIITRVKDRNGETLYERRPRQQQILDENTAFIMANMMKGVVQRGTATRIRALERPVAGKTGTTNDQMDAWFLGYTPEWVAGAWVGFDVKRNIGRYETGGKAAAPIFLYFMQEFLKDKPALDFDIPDGVIPVLINASTGRLTESDDQNAFLEYFKTGTEPRYSSLDLSIPQDYLSSEEF